MSVSHCFQEAFESILVSLSPSATAARARLTRAEAVVRSLSEAAAPLCNRAVLASETLFQMWRVRASQSSGALLMLRKQVAASIDVRTRGSFLK